MKTAKLGSSSNANKDPYAKFGFKGTEVTQKGLSKVKQERKGTLELMSPEEWEQFCVLRSHLSDIS